MAAKRVHSQQPDWQPDRSQSKKAHTSTGDRHAPIEVADMASGAMMDNVMRSREQQQQPATPPREFVQPKLTIGEPNDKYEQEADRVAKQVVQRMRAPNPPPLPNSDGEEPSLQCKHEAFQQIWRPILQADGGEGGTTSEEFDRTLNSARSGGQALDSNVQRSMGEAMGADFSGVKVHTDATANQLSESIQAKAFTTGRDVFFKRGTYQPGSKDGQELIAHELTHVVQQSGSEVQKKNDGMIQRVIYQDENAQKLGQQMNPSKAKRQLIDDNISESIAQSVVESHAGISQEDIVYEELLTKAQTQQQENDEKADEKSDDIVDQSTPTIETSNTLMDLEEEVVTNEETEFNGLYQLFTQYCEKRKVPNYDILDRIDTDIFYKEELDYKDKLKAIKKVKDEEIKKLEKKQNADNDQQSNNNNSEQDDETKFLLQLLQQYNPSKAKKLYPQIEPKNDQEIQELQNLKQSIPTDLTNGQIWKDLAQDQNKHTCSVLSNIGALYLLGQGKQIRDMVVAEDNISVTFKFADPIKLQPYLQNTTNLESRQKVEGLIKRQQIQYKTAKKLLEPGPLINTTKAWVNLILQAVAQHLKSLKALDLKSYDWYPDIALNNVKETQNSQEETINFNAVTGMLSKGAGISKVEQIENENEKQLWGKTIKIAGQGHATVIHIARDGTKTYFDNQNYDKPLKYPKDKKVSEILKALGKDKLVRTKTLNGQPVLIDDKEVQIETEIPYFIEI